MWPILFSVGNVHVYSYGVSLFIALLTVYVLAIRKLPSAILSRDHLDDLMLIIVSCLWLGGGVAYLFFSGNFGFPSIMAAQKWLQFSLFPVSLSVFVGGYAWCSWKKLSFIQILDFMMPFFILGYGVQRMLGCFSAGCCYGIPTDVAWAVKFPLTASGFGPHPGVFVHPTQLYLAATAFLTAGLLHLYKSRLRANGSVALFGGALISGFYFLISFYRGDMMLGHKFFGFYIGQILSAAVFFVVLVLLLLVQKNRVRLR